MVWSAFRTDTVSLRPFSPDDAPALEAYLNHPDLEGRRYIPWDFPEYASLSLQQIEAIIEKWGKTEDGLHLAVIHRETGDLLGHAECDWEWDPHTPSIAMVIDPARQRQGLGSQVLRLLISYLLEQTPAHNIASWIASWNVEALAFGAHHGFHQAGRMRRTGIRHGAYYDTMILDMLRPEWEAERGATDAS